MPSYAIKSSGIRQVAANSLIGNSTGSTGSAEELSATDAKTLLGLGAADGPTFSKVYLDNIYHSSGGGRLQLGSSGYTLYAELSCNRLMPRADATYDLGAETLAWRHIKNTGSILCYNGGASNGTNYERGAIEWNSNVLTIGTQSGGTGIDRDLELSPATGNVLVPATGKIAFSTRLTLNGSSRRLMTDNSQTLQLQGSSFTTSQTVSAVDIGGNFTDTDGDQKVLSLTPTYNQSGTAGSTDLLINRTETATGSGDQNLMDLQVGGTSKFKVTNSGGVSMPNLPTSDPASAGELWNDSGTLKVSAG